ncbi:uracil-DNA glycosylase [Elysia marginata]|uniref:Uracil-DNA glycosylase n=1 Tax=Elysia marginata TaxID=1093978 RepID=A0AAV4GSZ0_9GAST|nr:uracil-DNA glycosylase [Elysia marginata]
MSALASTPCFPNFFEGAHPAWPPFFEKYKLMPAASVLASKASLFFEFLRHCGPDDALVLIVMGPPTAPVSLPLDGLQKKKPPPVARNPPAQRLFLSPDAVSGLQEEELFQALRTSWASQGALLIDAALTGAACAQEEESTHREPFAARFVQALTAHFTALGLRLVCLLWGEYAQAFAPAAEGAEVYYWPYPPPFVVDTCFSPALRFETPPFFKEANDFLCAAQQRPVEWDPFSLTYAFTDGACLYNGKLGAKATYAGFILTGPLKGIEVSGRVEPAEYALIDPASPFQGFESVPGSHAAPTNNRGEYLAWCWILLLLLRGGVRGRVCIVSDCNLFIQTMENWLPARRKKGNAPDLKNYDLVCIGETLLAALRSACQGVTLLHIHSHQKKPLPEAASQAKACWYGNDRVDRVAGSLLKQHNGPNFVLNAAPPLAWCVHGRFARYCTMAGGASLSLF